jgi:hypothetical protein
LPSEGKGHTFESCRARQFFLILQHDMRARAETQLCLIRVNKQIWRKIVAEFG